MDAAVSSLEQGEGGREEWREQWQEEEREEQREEGQKRGIRESNSRIIVYAYAKH